MMKKAIALSLILIMIFTLTACSSVKSSVYVQTIADEAQATNSNLANEDLYLSYKAREDLIRVSRTDMSVLYFDEQTYSISVYDANSTVLWNSLPSDYIGQSCSMFTVDLIIQGHEYTLNSQDDSLALDLASYEIIDNTILVDYAFKTTIADVEVDFVIPLEFVAEDGKLTVKLDCSGLYENQDIEEVVIERINLMSYFGANTESSEGDYIVIPDGSGAIIDLSEKAQEFETLSTKVYSDDYSISETQNEASAIIASFGMKIGDAAFVALVESGEEIASINASKALESGEYNAVSASFELTTVITDEENNSVYYSTSPYDETISLSYRFLSDDNANYVGMASATRELLIRNSSLTTQTVEATSSLPMNITLIGSTVSLTSNAETQIETLTTFEQASQIISFLKSKDFNNLNIQYKWILKGSSDQVNVQDIDIIAKLGSDSEFEELLTTVSTQQGYNMYIDVNLFSASITSSFSSNAVGLFGNYSTISADSLNYQETDLVSLNLASPSLISTNTNELLRSMIQFNVSAVSLSDAGSILYSDNSLENSYSLTDTKRIISDQVSSISSSTNLMVDTGNLYTIKYADVIVNLPDISSVDELDYCTSIPYMQIILHGSVIYSSSAANLSDDVVYSMLKSIEYGAVPSFEWYYENLEDSYYYMNNISIIQSYYSVANSNLNDLTSAIITDHYEVQSGVYCTQYDNSTSIYINYNDEVVSIAGVDIQPLSFVRVN